jgi:triacylglycerol lipase
MTGGRRRQRLRSVINGIVGDHLDRSRIALGPVGSMLIQDMTFADPPEVTADVSTRDWAIFVHGLADDEKLWLDPREVRMGERLQGSMDLRPRYLRYNTGLPIAHNGRRLAHLLDAWWSSTQGAVDRVANTPNREAPPHDDGVTTDGSIGARGTDGTLPRRRLVLVGHSMGGLVLRRAMHVAAVEGHGWLADVTHAAYLGTPHLGAPLERLGRRVAATAASTNRLGVRWVAKVGDLRSAGIKDLGDALPVEHGVDLDADGAAGLGQGTQLDDPRAPWRRALPIDDPRHPMPLAKGPRHLLVAGTLVDVDPWTSRAGERVSHTMRRWFDDSVGDALVPLSSATGGRLDLPARRTRDDVTVEILRGVAHRELARSDRALDVLTQWLTRDAGAAHRT